MIFEGIEKETENLKEGLNTLFDYLRRHTQTIPSTTDEQIMLLKNIRSNIYEDLNQLQHKALIIESAVILQKEYPKINKWNWHPKQTSHPEEADLTGYINNEVFLNAEITTSIDPDGVADTKMRKTMSSLNKKKGLKFYFVQTEKMFNRAQSKINNNGWDITPRQISKTCT